MMSNPLFGPNAGAFYQRVTNALEARNAPVYPRASDDVVLLLHYSTGDEAPVFSKEYGKSFWTSGFTRSERVLRNLVNWPPEGKTWVTAMRFDMNQEGLSSSRIEIVRNGKHLNASEVVIMGKIGPDYLCHFPFVPTIELIDP